MVPVIYQPHCYKFDDPSVPAYLRGAYRLVEQLLAPRSTAVVVLTEHERRLTERLRPAVMTQYLPNVPSVTPTDSGSGREPDDHVFTIGRIATQKDPNYFLQMVQEVRAVRPNARFTWIGDGDVDLKLALEAGGVRVTGWLAGEQLARELSAPGIYVHCALYEGFPLSVLDAAASGHLVLARDIAAFCGGPVVTGSDVVDLAILVTATLNGDAATVAAVREGTDRLLGTMTTEGQRAALAQIYGLIDSAPAE